MVWKSPFLSCAYLVQKDEQARWGVQEIEESLKRVTRQTR